MLKVSAFYLEKQKSFIPKKNMTWAVVSKKAKRVPTDGALLSQFLVKVLIIAIYIHNLLNRKAYNYTIHSKELSKLDVCKQTPKIPSPKTYIHEL